MSDPKLTPERLAELRRVLEAATPGPWWLGEQDGGIKADGPMGREHVSDNDFDSNDEAFVLAFNPETARALLDEVDRLQRTVDRKDEQMGELQDALDAAHGVAHKEPR